MSMSDHIKQQVLQEFFAKKISFSWKTAKLDYFVLLEWKNQHTYRKYLTYLESRQRGTLILSVAQFAVQNNRKRTGK